MSTKEAQEHLVKNMRNWQKVENSAVASTGAIIEKTDNPIIRLVMEIIQRDSQMHYRIQDLIADTLEGKTIALNPDEVGKIWTWWRSTSSWKRRLWTWPSPASPPRKERRA